MNGSARVTDGDGDGLHLVLVLLKGGDEGGVFVSLLGELLVDAKVPT